MLGVCRRDCDKSSLTVDEFIAVLSQSFTEPALTYESDWALKYDERPDGEGYAVFEATLRRQIVDLREMRLAGTLDQKWIELGVNAPRGARWYNFTPSGYLECAAAGSVGGWEPGDDTGRQFVPGKVAVLQEDGSIGEANPEDLARDVCEIAEVTWTQFEDFIFCGQVYE